jgi:hypothetical protein
MTTKSVARISGSLRADELLMGAAVVKALLGGGDVSLLVRRPQFRRFAASISKMAARAEEAPVMEPVVRRRVVLLEWLRKQQRPVGKQEIVSALGWGAQSVAWMLKQERDAGNVRTVNGYRYAKYVVVGNAVSPVARFA